MREKTAMAVFLAAEVCFLAGGGGRRGKPVS
jgi:hypothetical protein